MQTPQTVLNAENDAKAEQDRCRSTDSRPVQDTTTTHSLGGGSTATAAAAGPPPIQPGPTPPTSRQNSVTGVGNTTAAAQNAKKINRFQVNPVTESGATVVESMSHPNLISAAASESLRTNASPSQPAPTVPESISAPSLNEIHDAIAAGQQGKMIFLFRKKTFARFLFDAAEDNLFFKINLC